MSPGRLSDLSIYGWKLAWGACEGLYSFPLLAASQTFFQLSSF